ncbi:MAG TPA: ATP-binding cassette domain-containing protein, partial [Terriglobales bacterium]|nr:ATP-binding cassette domain-containing protein [Terriglobales bacterium]
MQVPGSDFLQNTLSQLLEIRGLSIRYLPPGGSPVHPVKFVNLRVGAGEILGVMGESGSGKSTLATTVLRLLPAHAHPTAGAVLFEGRDVLTMRESELRTIRGSGIAMISQDPATSLNPVMKIGAQIGEVLRAHL